MWQTDLPSSKKYHGCRTLALVDAAEILFWLSELLAEICSTAEKYIVLPLNCYIEIKQLHKTLYSIHPVLDER